MDAHPHARPAQFPALLLRRFGAADAAVAGTLTALEAADVDAHAVVGESQPERHGDAEILGAFRLRAAVLPRTGHHDITGVRADILTIKIGALEWELLLHDELTDRSFMPRHPG